MNPVPPASRNCVLDLWVHRHRALWAYAEPGTERLERQPLTQRSWNRKQELDDCTHLPEF